MGMIPLGFAALSKTGAKGSSQGGLLPGNELSSDKTQRKDLKTQDEVLNSQGH